MVNCMKVIKIHYENGLFVGTTYLKTSDIFVHYNRPDTTIKKLVDGF